ncbi:toll/interleukin-1 receptor domain-containing protein [Corynebacterium sp.]|uniref:toll/interleukin-1 receptor domain-containing protein n=1 Tax=Corynebacterium sp. TaxID=1720 RepID=UPI0025BC9C67|nr:toll/interleukin-1 receptor domain-containing protein [Corynebacterium sp.]
MEAIVDNNQDEPPVVFISYSRASEEHAAWVRSLASRLRANKVDVHLDLWDVRLGHDLDLYMEKYGDTSVRVLVILSDDYGRKADARGEQHSGVGTETTVMSRTVYREPDSNRVIPIVPDSGATTGAPILPRDLGNRSWVDFREDYDTAFEKLLRELHGVPIESAPPLGKNPFANATEWQARANIRNSPSNWHDARLKGQIEINLHENGGRYSIGAGDACFDLHLDYPWNADSSHRPQDVRHYSGRIADNGRIGLIPASTQQAERFEDLSMLSMSNDSEISHPGDIIVMMNHQGYWALLILDEVVFRDSTRCDQPIALLRFVIASDRTASLNPDDLPARDS